MTQNSPAKSWLTEAEVAKLTGISVFTLRRNRFLSKGISYYKIGKSIRYSLEDIYSFMHERKINIPSY